MDPATTTQAVMSIPSTLMVCTTILGGFYTLGKTIDGRAAVKAANGNGNGHAMACPGLTVGTKTREGATEMGERMAVLETDVKGIRREMKLQFKNVFRLLGQIDDDPGSDDAPV